MRYPPHFPNWGGLEGANACVRGLERSFWRYASAEAIELITADAPRKRTPPKRDEEIVSFINAMTQGLSIEYQAILDGDVYQPGSGGIDETTGEPVDAPREEVATAPPMPSTEMDADDQPEEENDETIDPNHDLHVAARERAVNSLENLADGTFEIDNRVLSTYVLRSM